MKPFLNIVLGIAAIGAAAAADETAVFTSGPQPVPLIELFTSEGCSSCPPAERWLGELRHDTGLWRDFVPVAWHVNYWDRLGWEDVFASRAYTDRQYAYARAWRGNRVYTPGFVRAGREWRRDAGGLAPDPGAPEVGALRVRVVGERLEVDFAAVEARSDWRVHAARLGGGIVSPVRAGENRGRTLHHEFLVLGTASMPLGERGFTTLPLPERAPDVAVARDAIAVWVTRGAELVPVQATGGWLD